MSEKRIIVIAGATTSMLATELIQCKLREAAQGMGIDEKQLQVLTEEQYRKATESTLPASHFLEELRHDIRRGAVDPWRNPEPDPLPLELTDPRLAEHFRQIANGQHEAVKHMTFYGTSRAYVMHDGNVHISPIGRLKLGRNDPCHCGSGKKFKKCCA